MIVTRFSKICFGASLFALALFSALAKADEGMFPISEILNLDLRSKGLEMDPADIFNADAETCLVDGICRVNGCTGSFVSPGGLIITNHHCAFAAIQAASTTEHDYLTNGFISNNRDEEIPSPGYTVRITEGFEDVSERVLSVVTEGMTFTERTKAIEKQQKQLEKEAEAANPGMRAEVAEMFTGERYVLFLYTFIRDVRLVFAPPQSVGNYGGEIDNWEWPRHTGDFSFMRAYVAPDGSSAEYSPDNVPYKPKRFIKVAAEGVNENDFVMLLGYPGRTVRHNTASFLAYEENVRLPYIVELYKWEIETMEAAGANDRAIALDLASRIKSLANVEKRSRGQLKGLNRIGFVRQRQAVEKELQAFIDADPARKARAGSLLSQIDAVYAEMTETAQWELNFANLTSASQTLGFALTAVDAAFERQKDDLERESAYTDRNFDLTKQRMSLRLDDFHQSVDQTMTLEMLRRLRAAADGSNAPVAFVNYLSVEDDRLEQQSNALIAKSKMHDADFAMKTLEMSPDQLRELHDPAIDLMLELYPYFISLREKDKEREGKLSQLYGQLITEKREFLKTGFVPDANATLRLTHGRVESYSPEDAVVKTPITTLKGMLDKATGVEPFDAPPRIAELHTQKDFGIYANKELGDVPTCILYSTDSTGGNSGSPILNARGELVGVNFDRCFEATINDFAWNHAYSRSIGVDIRYVLWITDKLYGAKHLIHEMGVE
ncbi:MAG: S46 family peptidase [Pirellulaceae bacterium]